MVARLAPFVLAFGGRGALRSVWLPRAADFLAIPFWIMLLAYFLRKPELTPEEKVLTAFAGTGLAADIVFTLFRI